MSSDAYPSFVQENIAYMKSFPVAQIESLMIKCIDLDLYHSDFVNKCLLYACAIIELNECLSLDGKPISGSQNGKWWSCSQATHYYHKYRHLLV